MKIRLGYACVPVTIDETSSHTLTYTNYLKLGIKANDSSNWGNTNLTDYVYVPEIVAPNLVGTLNSGESGKMDLPVDGLVICYDDTEYASTGSVTGHHATRAGYAFKWQDESVESKLKYIEWSCAVSTISPVAVLARLSSISF